MCPRETEKRGGEKLGGRDEASDVHLSAQRSALPRLGIYHQIWVSPGVIWVSVYFWSRGVP